MESQQFQLRLHDLALQPRVDVGCGEIGSVDLLVPTRSRLFDRGMIVPGGCSDGGCSDSALIFGGCGDSALIFAYRWLW